MLAIAMVAIIIAIGSLTWKRAYYGFEYRRGVRDVAAWHEAVRTTPVPPGTLLYSADPADRGRPDAMVFFAGGGLWAHQGAFTVFDAPYPALRTVNQSYYSRSVYPKAIPRPIRHSVIFAAERRVWDAALGSKPMVVSVSYAGTTRSGAPAFYCRTFDIGNGTPPYTQYGAEVIAPPPGRPLTNPRIYAGYCHPADDTRFTLPFDTDGGRGRFEFQTDAFAPAAARAVPWVWIEWDSPSPTTLPATAPATRSATP